MFNLPMTMTVFPVLRPRRVIPLRSLRIPKLTCPKRSRNLYTRDARGLYCSRNRPMASSSERCLVTFLRHFDTMWFLWLRKDQPY